MSVERNPQAFEKAPINWTPAIVLLSTPLLAIVLVPWYLWVHGVNPAVWTAFAFYGMDRAVHHRRLSSLVGTQIL